MWEGEKLKREMEEWIRERREREKWEEKRNVGLVSISICVY